MKICERCGKEIPEEYGNLLCDDCYKKLEIPDIKISDSCISDPNYKENPEMEDKEQWKTNVSLFEKNNVLLWNPTRYMYTFIKNYCIEMVKSNPQYPKFIWKPNIIDIGCGSGVGTNILSQEANFVWGIDKNKKSIDFAKEAFTREKNGIYYLAQETFDHIDLITDTRDMMKFDVVVMIEVIEHIADCTGFLQTVIRKFDNGGDTEYFISTPNRNNDSISKDRPKNVYHVREWRSEEFYEMLSKLFKEVKFYNAKGEPIEGYSTNHTPLLAKCKL
jgi:2-polyprenyl-3-methyl-5-hydroxy-6-metoxy-1,4-benzoquinol methylase